MKKKLQFVKPAQLKLQREAIRKLDTEELTQVAAGKPNRSICGGPGCPIPVSVGDC
jgi:hypothetical protein